MNDGDGKSLCGERAKEADTATDTYRAWADNVFNTCDIMHRILSFLEARSYLFVAGISIHWRKAWGQRPRETSLYLAVQSCSSLDWAMASGVDIGSGVSRCAAAKGQLGVLRYAMELGFLLDKENVCADAAGGGHLGVVKWCRAKGCAWGLSSDHAAKGGYLEVLKWCIANGARLYCTTCASAAEEGHLDVLKWCRANGCPWDLRTSIAAACKGHWELLKWCWANDCPRDTWTCSGAAGGGHMEMLKWCRANGCPWDTWTCMAAAQGGHLEILKWCRANGCPWDAWTSSVAAKSGGQEMVEWCRANGCPE